MSFPKQAAALTLIGLLLSGTAVYAQVGGGDVPSDAKKQGEKEQPGSTGMSDKSGGGGAMKKGDAMKQGSGSTGGANGGSASKAGADGAGK